MKKLVFALLLALSVVSASCSRRPKLIPKSEFAGIYADMLEADMWLKDHHEFRAQADTTLFYEAVFQMHGYTGEDYIYSVGKYLQNPEEYSAILKRAAKILDQRIDEVSKAMIEESVSAAEEALEGASEEAASEEHRKKINGREDPVPIDFD